MTLFEVITAVDTALEKSGATGVNKLRPGMTAHIYRDVWIEHQSLPDMPIDWILSRHIGEGPCPEELQWWKDQGGNL